MTFEQVPAWTEAELKSAHSPDCHPVLVSGSLKTMNQYYVYILASHSHEPTIYIGITNNLERRLYEHDQKPAKSFTSNYNCNKLVYFEITSSAESAIEREKQLKRWHREWKLNLIRNKNPSFKDLSRKWNSQETLKQVQGDINGASA